MKKQYPQRYPYNPDAIGIEVVSLAKDQPGKTLKVYEDPTPMQNDYIHWFVGQLLETLHLTRDDVYRHPMLSAKNPTEAMTVTW